MCQWFPPLRYCPLACTCAWILPFLSVYCCAPLFKMVSSTVCVHATTADLLDRLCEILCYGILVVTNISFKSWIHYMRHTCVSAGIKCIICQIFVGAKCIWNKFTEK